MKLRQAQSALVFVLLLMILAGGHFCACQRQAESVTNEASLSPLGVHVLSEQPGASDSPEDVVTKLVTKSFELTERSDLLLLETFLAQEQINHLRRVTEETFQKHYGERRLALLDLSITDVRKISSLEVAVEYRIHFLDATSGSPTTDTTITKIASVVLEQDQWKVRAIESLSTEYTMLESLVIEATSPASPSK